MRSEEVILNLIKSNKTLEEIAAITGLSLRNIYLNLKKIRDNGYLISKKYYYNGEIKYGFNKSLENQCDNILLTSLSENEFKFMVISDLHLGSLYETPKLLNLVYDYCTNNNIHIILNAGDFIDGEVNCANTKILPTKQIDHALRIHPISSQIINYLVLGNHDYSMLVNHGIDILKVIKDKREDIVPLGFGEGILKIKNDQIVIQHPLLYRTSSNGNYSKTLIIRGHGHAPKINLDTSNLLVYAPSLSNLNFNKCHFPGAINLNIKMRCGLIENVYIEELAIINNKIYVTNELNLYVGHNKTFKIKEEIQNEEEYPKILRKEI